MNLLIKFHEDRKENVAFRTNLLTKFHEDWTLNVASREKCPAPCGHVFKATKTISELIQDNIGTNLLTNFHDDRKINVTSRVFTRKIAPHLWWPYIIRMNLLTKFHKDRTINNVPRAPRAKNAPPPGGHVFQPTGIIFELIQDIIGMNLLTKKNAPPLGSHVFKANVTIFELIQDSIKTNLLTKFHEDWTINANVDGSRHTTHDGLKAITKAHHFELIQDISGTNLLTKFHEYKKINVASRVLTRKNARPPGSRVFQPTANRVYPTDCFSFWAVVNIIGINLLTKFYEDQTINVASREKCPAPWQPFFQANVTIFELIQDIIETNLLTKFHEDWK
ncbi:hypothetical protein DPMN_183630 [Dreissena polymorpha]|uniref:Uncharacterized protein n=1 Tax=Dreissena polymorpha TaxID=45954 RepID=A0A9D4I5P9_DREPO|nr:hypothetical protein DPMN_183630 [Dreissena polymorpha]